MVRKIGAETFAEQIAGSGLQLSSHSSVFNTAPDCFGELRESNDIHNET